MAGNLQTLGFQSPLAMRGGVPRLVLFPTSRAPFRQTHLAASAIPSLYAEARLVTRRPRATGGSDEVDGGRQFNAKDFSSLELFRWAKSFLEFARNNFLPLANALVSGISLGLANPSLGHLADRYPLTKFSTIGIFFISGLMLRSEEIGAAVEAWPAGILGLTSILLLTPFFSRAILQVHLNPYEFVTGLAIFCCMPTTLSSGVALTQVPFSLALFVGGVGVSIPTMQLFKSLVMTLLVPLALGKVSRSKSLLLTVRPEVFATAVTMGALLHIVLLALNTFAVRILSMLSGDKQSILSKRENARAVIIVASQKTLPVMVAVVEQLRGALGEPGLLVLPCVAAHINQIIIDSFLVNWWIKNQPSITTKEA